MLKQFTKGITSARVSVAIFVLAAFASAGVGAGESPALPRYESLKEDMVYMREGPSTEHRIKWVYHRKGLPVEVLAEFEVWRRVRDGDGEIGWIHVAMLSRDRTALIRANGLVPVRRREDSTAVILADAQPGAIGHIEACGPIACELKFDAVEGWVDRSFLWGIYADEHL